MTFLPAAVPDGTPGAPRPRGSSRLHSPDRVRSPHVLAVRFGLPALLAMAPVAVGVAALAGGGSAALGALVGVAVVAGFFTLSVVVVEAANRRDPALTLPAALTTYVVKVVVLGVLAFSAPTSWGPARPAFAVTLVAGTLLWLVAQSVGVWRTPPMLVLPERPRPR